jgi:REP element-mobilizing transposase RayT
MTYNPSKHHRKSIRLKGYDYSSPGHYFITICVQNKACLFGEVIDGKMMLNDAGKMIDRWYLEIENKYSVIKCNDHITMPNHFHCLIEIPSVGMAQCGHPEIPMAQCGHPINGDHHPSDQDTHAGMGDTHTGVSLRESQRAPEFESESDDQRVSIFEIMDWFKTMSTNEYIRGVKTGIWHRFEKRFWQLRYWDHIVRNEKELFAIRQYINNNPLNWDRDKLNGGTGNRVFEPAMPYGEEPWMI